MIWDSGAIFLHDIDKLLLLKYFQYKFPLSHYTLNNFNLRQFHIRYIQVTSPDNIEWRFSKVFYNDCLEYNKIKDREEIINNILNSDE